MHEPPHDYVLVGDGELYERSDGGLSYMSAEPLFSTGLADAGGNEIYQADILRIKGSYEEGEGYIEFPVRWFNDTSCFAAEYINRNFFSPLGLELKDSDRSYLVSGNIFEDIELLPDRDVKLMKQDMEHVPTALH